LKARGFERRGLKFVRRASGNGFVSLIELQPSRRSTSEQLLFVINFGVIVPSFFAGDDLTKPEYGGCHWGGRVSDKDGVETWLPVRADDDVEQLALRVTELLEHDVLPALEAKQRDEDLIKFWKSGQSPLLVDAQRLLFLGTLLHRAGRKDEFEEIKAELERKARDPFSLRAVSKLKELAD
jgi:hypothetical protein